MKIFRALVASVAALVLALALAIRLNPSLLILAAGDVTSRSPFCSSWQAALDGRIKLHQQEEEARITSASHLVRREAGLALWSTPDGSYWIPDGNDTILPTLLAQESRNIYGMGEWGVQPGNVVLDVGAYIGTWTKQALARGAKLVVAIEPTPSSVECLKRNLAAEVAAGKVIIVPEGIWDSEGSLTLFANSSNGVGNSFVERNERTENVDAIPVITVDKLVAKLGLMQVDFIKADVKGATERMLRGASSTIKRDRPRIAVSTEEVSDSAGGVAQLAKKIEPRYQLKCGPCLTDRREVYTDVLFFR